MTIKSPVGDMDGFDLKVHRFGGQDPDDEVLGEPLDSMRKSWKATEHLRRVRMGTKLRNTISGHIGYSTREIDRECPFVQVILPIRKGYKKRRRTRWAVRHVEIVK